MKKNLHLITTISPYLSTSNNNDILHMYSFSPLTLPAILPFAYSYLFHLKTLALITFDTNSLNRSKPHQ